MPQLSAFQRYFFVLAITYPFTIINHSHDIHHNCIINVRINGNTGGWLLYFIDDLVVKHHPYEKISYSDFIEYSLVRQCYVVISALVNQNFQ